MPPRYVPESGGAIEAGGFVFRLLLAAGGTGVVSDAAAGAAGFDAARFVAGGAGPAVASAAGCDVSAVEAAGAKGGSIYMYFFLSEEVNS